MTERGQESSLQAIGGGVRVHPELPFVRSLRTGWTSPGTDIGSRASLPGEIVAGGGISTAQDVICDEEACVGARVRSPAYLPRGRSFQFRSCADSQRRPLLASRPAHADM